MTTLRIAKTLVSTAVNGPGQRFVIWVQGCRLGCPGCFNPEFWSETKGTEMTVDELAAQIKSTPGIEGVTFSGGEPLQQAAGLLALMERLRPLGLSFLCNTGHIYKQILQDQAPDILALLEHLDILIDGPFEQDQKASLMWRGSRNQRVIFLTERYAALAPLVTREGQQEVELVVGADGVNITGIFDMALWRKLKGKITS